MKKRAGVGSAGLRAKTRRLAISALSIALFCALSSCGLNRPLERFISELRAPGASYTRGIVCRGSAESAADTFEIVTKRDGNKTYASSFFAEGETYSELVDGATYEYRRGEDGKWAKERITPDRDLFDVSKYDAADFDYVAERFVLKESALEKYSFLSATIAIDEKKNELTMVATVLIAGEPTNVAVFIERVGATEVVLPSV